MNNSDIKRYAKQTMSTNMGQSRLIMFLYVLISGLVGSLSSIFSNFGDIGAIIGAIASAIATLFVTLPMTFGLYRFFIYNQPGLSATETLFSTPDKLKQSGKFMLLTLQIWLWSLLLVIPGIIKVFQYAMVPFIIADNPYTDLKSAKQMSKEMMQGHKMQYFLLNLSLIGWWMLASITFTVAGFLYVYPYAAQVNTTFYNGLKNGSSQADINNPRTYVNVQSQGMNYQQTYVNNGMTQGQGYSQQGQNYNQQGYSQQNQGYGQQGQSYNNQTYGYNQQGQNYNNQNTGYNRQQSNYSQQVQRSAVQQSYSAQSYGQQAQRRSQQSQRPMNQNQRPINQNYNQQGQNYNQQGQSQRPINAQQQGQYNRSTNQKRPMNPQRPQNQQNNNNSSFDDFGNGDGSIDI